MRDQLRQAIVIELQPSFLLLGLLLLIAIFAFISVEKLAVTVTWQWVLRLLILVSTVYYSLRDALLLLPASWLRLEVNVKGELALTNRKGQVFKPELANDSFIYYKLIILNFKRHSRFSRLPPCILFDQADQVQQQRQLRVWLKWFEHDH